LRGQGPLASLAFPAQRAEAGSDVGDGLVGLADLGGELGPAQFHGAELLLEVLAGSPRLLKPTLDLLDALAYVPELRFPCLAGGGRGR
jgi:hypothetical protein